MGRLIGLIRAAYLVCAAESNASALLTDEKQQRNSYCAQQRTCNDETPNIYSEPRQSKLSFSSARRGVVSRRIPNSTGTANRRQVPWTRPACLLILVYLIKAAEQKKK